MGPTNHFREGASYDRRDLPPISAPVRGQAKSTLAPSVSSFSDVNGLQDAANYTSSEKSCPLKRVVDLAKFVTCAPRLSRETPTSGEIDSIHRKVERLSWVGTLAGLATAVVMTRLAVDSTARLLSSGLKAFHEAENVGVGYVFALFSAAGWIASMFFSRDCRSWKKGDKLPWDHMID